MIIIFNIQMNIFSKKKAATMWRLYDDDPTLWRLYLGGYHHTPRTSHNPPRPARDGSLVERCGIPHNKTSRRDDTLSVIPAGHGCEGMQSVASLRGCIRLR